MPTFGFSTGYNQAVDVALNRIGPGILAQYISTSAQTNQVFGTRTDASNGAWLESGYDTVSNAFFLRPMMLGSGLGNKPLFLGSISNTIAPALILYTNGIAQFSYGQTNIGRLDLRTPGDGSVTFITDASSSILNVNGLLYVRNNNSTVEIGSATVFNWGSTSNPQSSPDLGLRRLAAGLLQITDGATGFASPVYKTQIVPQLANYTVTTNELQSVMTDTANPGPGNVNFTLPAAVIGYTFTFQVTAVGITVTAVGSDTIRIGTSVSATAGNVTCTTIGNSITLTCTKANKWVATAHEGTWTVN